MYVPKHFKEDEPQALAAYIKEAPFATLVGVLDDAPFATHLPLHLSSGEEGNGVLYGHVARANPHWKTFDGEQEQLAVFTGPNAYVTPNWLGAKNAVPTWNYVAVHAYGDPRIIEDPEQVLEILARLARDHETAKTGFWTADKMDQDVLHGMLKGIVAFEMPISRMEGKRKMSQNKPEAVQRSAISGLRQMDDPRASRVAEIMEAGTGN